MVFKILCILVFRTKVVSALVGLKSQICERDLHAQGANHTTRQTHGHVVVATVKICTIFTFDKHLVDALM